MQQPDRAPGTVLVVDDDKAVRRVIGQWLDQAGYNVEVCRDGRECLDALGRLLPDAICLDLNMPVLDGITALKRIRSTHSHLPVVILTGDAEIDTVVKTMRLGAYDYLVKPIDSTKLLTTVANAVKHHRLSMRLVELEREVEGGGYPGLVGSCAAMKKLFSEMDRLADSDITVLIHGESGTGKELVAHAIHDHSGRRDGPFVAINCAAIPETLQESELFGYERGAFTGAETSRQGRFELANTGTLFFDEIGELSQSLQAKLLRVLQEKKFHRVGGNREIETDFRLLAATHRTLADEVEAGRFREDLFFRIVVYELDIPALRDRREDIPDLTRHFLAKYRNPKSDRVLRVSPEAMTALQAYDWPGNVRELENIVQRAMVMCDGDLIEVSHLPEKLREPGLSNGAPGADGSEHVAFSPPAGARPKLPITSLDQLERWAIEAAYERTGGDVPTMVHELGIGRSTLYRKLKQFGLR